MQCFLQAVLEDMHTVQWDYITHALWQTHLCCNFEAQ